MFVIRGNCWRHITIHLALLMCRRNNILCKCDKGWRKIKDTTLKKNTKKLLFAVCRNNFVAFSHFQCPSLMHDAAVVSITCLYRKHIHFSQEMGKGDRRKSCSKFEFPLWPDPVWPDFHSPLPQYLKCWVAKFKALG